MERVTKRSLQTCCADDRCMTRCTMLEEMNVAFATRTPPRASAEYAAAALFATKRGC
jgi:hypothetical protein